MNIYFMGMLISMFIYIFLGIVISKNVKNANDFYVAGRNAPTFLIVGSLVASYCSTGLFMGDVGEAFDGFYTPVLITIGMLITGYVLGSVFFGKYLRRSNALTIPEFFGKRFNSKKIGILAAITGLVIYLVYLLSIMQGIGTLMHYVTNINYNVCIFFALITFTLLTVMSGSKGVLITDTIMFGIFTVTAILGAIIIVVKSGGWFETLKSVTMINSDIFSWHGNLKHYYSTGLENMIWAIMTGFTWIAVCMVGPWQSSRYLMSKDEHTVIRSSTIAAFFVFLIEFLMLTVGAFIVKYNPDISSPSYAMIWGATHLLPAWLGVSMLTGVLAAGISSATTFLSLVGASFANDLFDIKDEKKKILFGRIAIIIVAIIVYILSAFNPPNIYIIMCLSGTVVVCAWFPVCVASIWSKRITSTGAFWGMLLGFFGCAVMKIGSAVFQINIPIYLDAFFVGIILNIIGMVVGSKLTKVSLEEKQARQILMKIPDTELDSKQIKVTKKFLFLYIGFGVVILLILLFLWAIPYTNCF